MTGTTWSGLEAGLAGALAELPAGTVLQLSEVALPVDGGYYAQLWQAPDRLHAEISGNEVLRPDRRVPDEAQPRIRSLGWDPPGTGNPVNWSAALDWPATTAEYRRLAGRLIAVLSDVFGIGTPADLAYRCWRADTGREYPLPGIGLDPLEVRYWLRPGPGGPDRPAELLRRVRIDWRITDTTLTRDGSWAPTDTLDRAELMELGEDLVEIDDAEAVRIAAGWGEAPLRWTATPRIDGRPGGHPPLDDDERAAVAGYLRGAPVVIAVLGLREDPLDPARPAVVPLSIRTDGTFVWSESDGYFAQRYGIAPEPEFLAHIQRQGYRPPEVDDATLLRAARVVDERGGR